MPTDSFKCFTLQTVRTNDGPSGAVLQQPLFLQVSETCSHLRGATYLAEDWCVSVGEGVVEVLSGQQARGQAVHAQALGVQQRVREGAHLSPVHVQHAGAQLLP